MKMDRSKVALTGVVAALALYLLFVAVGLQVDFFDSYELFLNAQGFANLNSERYAIARPIGATLMLVPHFLFERITSFNGISFVSIHVFAVFIYVAFIFTSYRIFRLALSTQASALAAVLLAFNTVLLRVAPFGKEDVLGSLLFSLGVYFYLSAKQNSIKRLLLSGAFIGFAMSVRYNLVGIGILIFAVNELLKFNKKEFLLKAATLGVFPCLVFFTIVSVTYAVLGMSTLFEAPFKFSQQFSTLISNNQGYEDPIQYVIFLVKSASLPVAVMAIVGAIIGVTRKRLHARFHSVWLFLFVTFMAYAIGHKEARYLLPAIPAFYFLVGMALEEGFKYLKKPAARMALIALTVAWPSYLAIGECIRYNDPVYSKPFQSEVSLYAADLAQSNRMIWIGTMYSVNPKDYLFDAQDEFTSIYHFASHVVTYYTQKRVYNAAFPIIYRDKNWTTHLDPRAVVQLNDGDVLIVNAETFSNAANVPAQRQPIVVQRVKHHVFDAGSRPPALPAGHYTLAIAVAEGWVPVSFLQLTDEASQGKIIKENLSKVKSPFSKFSLISYDAVRSFPLPERGL